MHTHKFQPFNDEAFVTILKFYDIFILRIKHTQKILLSKL